MVPMRVRILEVAALSMNCLEFSSDLSLVSRNQPERGRSPFAALSGHHDQSRSSDLSHSGVLPAGTARAPGKVCLISTWRNRMFRSLVRSMRPSDRGFTA